MKLSPVPGAVLRAYNHVSLKSYRDGMVWYDVQHDFAVSLDPENPARAAGVIAAMSPMNGWAQNKIDALRLYDGQTRGIGLEANVTKAVRILCGEAPLDVLGGDKVRAFYSTILDPHNPDAVPVIDRHAHDIAVGMRTSNKHPSKNMTKRRYEEFARIYQESAHIVGIGAPQLQAITWLDWRERIGVAFYG